MLQDLSLRAGAGKKNRFIYHFAFGLKVTSHWSLYVGYTNRGTVYNVEQQ